MRRLPGGPTILYALHTASSPAQAQWSAYLGHIERGLTLGPPEELVGLVISDGGAPDAVQRRALLELVEGFVPEGHSPRSAILSDSVLVRGVVTALTWFHADIRVYSPAAVSDALSFLQVDPVHRGRLRADLSAIGAEMGAIATLDPVLRHLS